MATTKFLGYARVSTDDQNLTLQIDALKKAGVAEDDIYRDKASGGTTDRPGFVDMWKDLRPGDTLVVWKLDRLGRSVSQLIQTVEKIEKRGAELLVLQDYVNTKTAPGRLMFHIMAAVAQFEREVGVERTMAGLAAAKAQGRTGGAKRLIPPEKVARARAMIVDEKLTVAEAAKKLKVQKGTLYKWLRIDEPQGAEDLED